MRIEIMRVADVDSGVVEFRCDAGTAMGYWEGATPAEGVVDVEVDAPDEVTEWVAREDATAGLLETAADGARVRIVGTVEEIGDPVVVIRVGPGLVLVEFAGTGPALAVGTVVEFTVPRIRLFPTDL